MELGKTFLAMTLFVFLGTLSGARAGEGPALDLAAFPQDTPQKALVSAIKALDAERMPYYLTHLIVPAEKEAQVKKHGSLADAAKHQNRAKKQGQINTQVALLKDLLASGKVTEGVEKGVKWARFSGDAVAQFEQLPDGRWVMNPRVTK